MDKKNNLFKDVHLKFRYLNTKKNPSGYFLGEYDALLKWPFRQKVTLTLLDQSADQRHLTEYFQPDPNSSSFQRPATEMNVASGCPLFVSHAVLENPQNGYLKDDTIFIRILVESSRDSMTFL